MNCLGASPGFKTKILKRLAASCWVFGLKKDKGGDMFLDLIRQRRSIRRFQDRPVETEKIEALCEAVLRSPSSRGFNPWEFIFVTDPPTIADLSRAKAHGSSFLAGAPLAVVILADPQRSDVWIEDAAIAALIVHLAATDLGLGSCWIQIRQRPHDENLSADRYVTGLLGIPEGLAVEAVVAVGYAVEEKPSHADDTLERGKLHFQRY